MASDLLSLVFDVKVFGFNLLRAPSNAGARAAFREALGRLDKAIDLEKAKRLVLEAEGLPELRGGDDTPEPPAHVTDVPPAEGEDPGRPVERPQPAPRLPYKED